MSKGRWPLVGEDSRSRFLQTISVLAFAAGMRFNLEMVQMQQRTYELIAPDQATTMQWVKTISNRLLKQSQVWAASDSKATYSTVVSTPPFGPVRAFGSPGRLSTSILVRREAECWHWEGP